MNRVYQNELLDTFSAEKDVKRFEVTFHRGPRDRSVWRQAGRKENVCIDERPKPRGWNLFPNRIIHNIWGNNI